MRIRVRLIGTFPKWILPPFGSLASEIGPVWLSFGTRFNLQVPVEILEGGQIPSLDPKGLLLQERFGTWNRGQMLPVRTSVKGGGHTSTSGPHTGLGAGTLVTAPDLSGREARPFTVR